ncbi:uncharacterized protein LOC116247255 [Nymphaea colorata]|uniref:Uncharacterized protein n=1 Tax=Nymphaea colorata TaxID=210225 RepID=A0A5K1AE67_9MAGN|nr:uncharacterized protein LOC116247255 [Nymphaea colorata]
MNKVPKQSRGSPQTLPAAKPTRRRKPLSDRNSSSSTSSDAPLPPRGCFRFLLSNSNSRSTPRKSPKPNEQSSASSSRPRCRSRAPPLGNGGKDQSSQEIAKNGGTCTRPPDNGTHPCPSSSSNGNYTISTPGRVNEQGAPPVQASISPEIHCGSEVVKDGSACFAAGHLVSKVKDRRKCRPRGILTVGENVKLGVEMDCKVNASAIVPIPAEASVRWLASPGDAKGSSQNGSSTSPRCSPRDGIEVGKDGRFRKLGWEMSGQTGVDRCCDAKADAGNGSFASPWNDTGTVIQYKCGSLFDQNKAADCHKYGCEDEESTKNGLHDSPGVEVKVEFENKGGPREATNSCITGSYSEDSQKKSFAFDRDELILGETMWFRDKDCSDSLELGHGTGGGDDHNCCRSGESPKNGSFVFSGLVCFPSDEVELGFQYNWVRSPSNFSAEDGTLEWELRSKNSFRSDKYEVAVTHSENKPTQSLLEAEISDPTFGHEVITNHPEVNRRQSLSEVETSPHSVGYEDTAPDIKALRSLSEVPCSSGTESASARCDLHSTSKALSSSSESNYRKRHQNHPDKQTCCIEFQENRHEEASPISEETSFCECNRLLGCADISESTATHKYGVTVGRGNMLDVDESREASLVPRENPSSESKRLLSKLRSESDGKVGHQDCSPTGNKFSKLDLRKCKEGSLVIQEAPSSEDKEPFSCLNISEISPVSSPFSDGSLWKQNAMCTPSTDSDVGSFEPNSMDEVLRTLRETHDRSDFLPLPGFDFRFYCPATPYHSANGARMWDPSTDLDAIRLEELHERGNELLSPTFDNISHMRISWREGLVSRMFEMDAPDISDWKLEAEDKTHSEFDFDHDPNLGSPVLDDEKLLELGSGFGSFELLNEPQDRGTKDLDWKLCYRNSLFEETA